MSRILRYKDDPDMFFWQDSWRLPLPWSKEVWDLRDRLFSFQDPIKHYSKGAGFTPTEYNLDLFKANIDRDENTLFMLHGFKNMAGVTLGEVAFLYCRNSCWVDPFDFENISYRDFEDGLVDARNATKGDYSALAWLMALRSVNGLDYEDVVAEIESSYRYKIHFEDAVPFLFKGVTSMRLIREALDNDLDPSILLGLGGK